MLEKEGLDLFEFVGKAQAICITTNGTLKQEGRGVMGRGCAKEALDRWPQIDLYLGNAIKKHGNIVVLLGGVNESGGLDNPYRYGTMVISFPVKRGWWEKASIDLIKESGHALINLSNQAQLKEIILPRPGCGNGGLGWPMVRKALEPILDDRFVVITN